MTRVSFVLFAVTLCTLSTIAVATEAQVPIPSAATPTLHGGTPIGGKAVLGEVGYAALKGSVYLGLSGDSDIGIEAALPSFGNDSLPGWGQDLGIDVRAPYRVRIVDWARAAGAFKIGPYFHVGRACKNCDTRSLGLGVVGGFVTDFQLPKLFKLIVGVEQQMGMVNFRNRDVEDGSTYFAAATFVDLGLEAFWKELFFTLLFNVGAQYGSDELYNENHALFRQMVGCGYKWQ